MGGFLGLGHSSAKTDRRTFLEGTSAISNIFNYALPTGKTAFGAGQETLGKAGDYYKSLLSGNRQALLGAVAPETNVVRSEADAQKRQLAASGTARGGGVAAANQQRETDTMSKIDNLLFGVRPMAAAGATKVGAVQLSAALQMLGLSAEEANTLTDESRLSRPDSHKINQDIVGKVAQTALNLLGAPAS